VFTNEKPSQTYFNVFLRHSFRIIRILPSKIKYVLYVRSHYASHWRGGGMRSNECRLFIINTINIIMINKQNHGEPFLSSYLSIIHNVKPRTLMHWNLAT